MPQAIAANPLPASYEQLPNGLAVPRELAELSRQATAARVASRIAFEGAEDTRWTEDWLAPQLSPIDLIADHQPKLRDRIRSLARNAPWLRSLIIHWVDNVVGTGGWRLQAKPALDDFGEQRNEPLAKRLELLWRRWGRGVDVNRRQSLEGFLREAEGEYAETGEYFIRLVPTADRWVVPLALQLIPPERLDATLMREPRATGGRPVNRITHGIEYDGLGRRVAYHFEPDDFRGKANPFGPKLRVPAAQVLHRFCKVRTGVERGVPPLFAAILLLRDFDDALEYEMEAWKAQARVPGVMTTESGGILSQSDERDATDLRAVHRVDGVAFVELRKGEALDFPSQSRPSNKLDPFMTFANRTLGRTVGYSYEAISGDYSKVNFASGRLGGLTDMRTSRRNQAELRDLSLDPIYDEWLLRAVLVGAVPELDATAYLADPMRHADHAFTPPGWQHHDEVKAATAAGLRMLLGLSTLQQEAAALGLEWEENLEQLALEMQRRTDLGLPMVTVGGAGSATGRGNEGFGEDGGGSPVPAGQDDDESGDDDDDDDDGDTTEPFRSPRAQAAATKLLTHLLAVDAQQQNADLAARVESLERIAAN